MAELSEARVSAVRQLVERMPDAALRKLDAVLARGGGDPALASVQTIVGEEMFDRQVCRAAFQPLVPLFGPSRSTPPGASYPRDVLSLTWAALRQAEPGLIAEAQRLYAAQKPEDEPPPIYDELCRRAANGLKDQEPAFGRLAQRLSAQGSYKTHEFDELLALAPLARVALRRLPVWVKTLSNEYAAAIRLAFRDAVAIGEDAAPPFMEILYGHLEEPHQVLRLISLVMDKPTDRYLASSELATFGDRLLADIDRRVDDVKRFDASRGLEGGIALAQSVQTAVSVIAEFEQWLTINRDGPWGSKIVSQKKALVGAVEARLKEAETAVAVALPTFPPPNPKSSRGAPRLDADPDPAAVLKAQSLMGFLNESRFSASYSGFGTVRTKVAETLDGRLDNYAEDLLNALHAGPSVPPERVRAFIDIGAEFLGLVRDPKAAEIVRRRAAVA